MSVLTVYKASAGSGKTFRLTREYLKLLFESAYNYKRILAVTFTNKAAGEMKVRIIGQLNSLANGSEILLKQISKETGLTPAIIQDKSKLALKVLLHDYSRFSIGTIDSFFQKVIRSFAKEMGLPFGYVVELDNEKILDEAIDRLLIAIDDNELLKSWLVQFSENKMEEGNSWDFKKDIINLAKEIFKEGYSLFDAEFVRKIAEKDFLSNYSKDLTKLKQKFENDLAAIGNEALLLIKNNSLTINDFSYKESGVAGYLKKIAEKKDFVPGARVLNALDNFEKWCSKSSDRKEDVQNIVGNGLNGLLNKAISYYETNNRSYNTAKVVLNFIYSLGILSDISNHVKEYNDEKNIFLLSDSSKLLQMIIAGNDSPFVYEKTGNHYKYFMIDEFQDTSVLQWENFKPLIINSLSEGNNNLLVGDVKQSIYRWRNSNWKILAEQVENEFVQEQFQIKNLTLNWRSKKNVIDFNNRYFYHASQLLQRKFNNEIDSENIGEELNSLKDKITNAYSDYFQESPAQKDNEGGCVKVKFIEEGKDEKWKERAKDEIPVLLESLQDRNCRLKDIAILVRNKKEGKAIADILIAHKNKQISDKYRFDFISNDSLFIKNASSVQLLQSILTYFVNPEDRINKAFIVHEYLRYIRQEDMSISSMTDFFEEGEDARDDWFFKYLPTEFKKELSALKQLPLPDLLEYLIQYFSLHRNEYELPYLQAFQEVALEYSRRYTIDISSFLDWWDEAGANKTLAVSEQQDAIQILTIHKSKGLEFKIVIIPFCDWDLEQTRITNIIWCKPEIAPFDQLGVVPVKYSSSLSNTFFYKEYYEEKLQSFVDNLNLMYVAFTRAEDELYVFAKKPDKKEVRCRNASELLSNVLNEQGENEELIDLSKCWDLDREVLQVGEIIKYDASVQPFERKRFTMKSYSVSSFSDRLKLNLHGKNYFILDKNDKIAKVNRGKIMHELFSKIKVIDDLDIAITELVMSGKLTKMEGSDLRQTMNELLNQEKVKSWFSADWVVKNESDILLKGGKMKRPDRVLIKGKKAIIIDYKFGEIEKNSHLNQVEEYAECLRKMGYDDVSGYVWYVDLNRVDRIQNSKSS